MDQKDAGTFAHTLTERLRTQDPWATSHPIFTVQQRFRIWGIDPDYTETFAWMNAEDQEVDPAMAATLEAGLRAQAPTPDGYRRIGYLDTWDFVTACLTEAGAQAYIDLNRHNLRDPRIYVASGYRNQEWIDLRAFFIDAPTHIYGIEFRGDPSVPPGEVRLVDEQTGAVAGRIIGIGEDDQ